TAVATAVRRDDVNALDPPPRFTPAPKPPSWPVADDPVTSRLVLVATTHQQAETSGPVGALDLYDSPTVAAIRDRLGGIPPYRRRLRLLSARYHVVHPDQNLIPYRHPLTWSIALGLRDHLAADLYRDPTIDPPPKEILIIANPLWMVALAR